MSENVRCAVNFGVERIRHLASAVGGLRELSFYADRREIKFLRDADSVTIDVVYGGHTPESQSTVPCTHISGVLHMTEVLMGPQRVQAEAQKKHVEEAKITAKIAAADAERARIQAAAEQKRQEEREQQLRKRGRGWYVWFDDEETREALEETLDENVSMVAIADGYFCIFDGGAVEYDLVPRPLNNKLHGRQQWLPKPNVVAMGSMQRYYVQFADGKYQCEASENFKEVIDNAKDVHHVAFGEYPESWVILHDGDWSYGDDTPDDLVELLADFEDPEDIELVNMGPHGEWFVSSSGGEYWIEYGNMPHDEREYLSDELEEIDKHKFRVNRGESLIRNVVFGNNGYFVVRYIEY